MSQYERTLLNVVIGQRPCVVELLTSEDKALLIRGDPFLILNLGLDGLDRIGCLDFERDGLARQRLDKDLHCTFGYQCPESTTKTYWPFQVAVATTVPRPA